MASRRATKFLTDRAWREIWLEGGARARSSDDPDLRTGWALASWDGQGDPDWEVRWLGRREVVRSEGASESVRTDSLVAALEDPHPAVVASALREAAFLDVPWPMVRERLAHDSPVVRRAAWGYLEEHAFTSWDHVDAAEVVSILEAALDDPDPVVRWRAIEALPWWHDGSPEQLTALFRRALTDDHRLNRRHATSVLPRFLESSAVVLPELVPELVVRLAEAPEEAAEALGSIGRAAAPALPELRAALGSEDPEDPEVAEAAALAIWRISGDTEPLSTLVAAPWPPAPRRGSTRWPHSKRRRGRWSPCSAGPSGTTTPTSGGEPRGRSGESAARRRSTSSPRR